MRPMRNMRYRYEPVRQVHTPYYDVRDRKRCPYVIDRHRMFEIQENTEFANVMFSQAWKSQSLNGLCPHCGERGDIAPHGDFTNAVCSKHGKYPLGFQLNQPGGDPEDFLQLEREGMFESGLDAAFTEEHRPLPPPLTEEEKAAVARKLAMRQQFVQLYGSPVRIQDMLAEETGSNWAEIKKVRDQLFQQIKESPIEIKTGHPWDGLPFWEQLKKAQIGTATGRHPSKGPEWQEMPEFPKIPPADRCASQNLQDFQKHGRVRPSYHQEFPRDSELQDAEDDLHHFFGYHREELKVYSRSELLQKRENCRERMIAELQFHVNLPVEFLRSRSTRELVTMWPARNR